MGESAHRSMRTRGTACGCRFVTSPAVVLCTDVRLHRGAGLEQLLAAVARARHGGGDRVLDLVLAHPRRVLKHLVAAWAREHGLLHAVRFGQSEMCVICQMSQKKKNSEKLLQKTTASEKKKIRASIASLGNLKLKLPTQTVPGVTSSYFQFVDCSCHPNPLGKKTSILTVVFGAAATTLHKPAMRPQTGTSGASIRASGSGATVVPWLSLWCYCCVLVPLPLAA